MLQEGAAMDSQCPSWAPVLGYMGVAAAVGLSNWGSAVRLCHLSSTDTLNAMVILHQEELPRPP